jgi:hypothetical protein
MAFSPRSLNGLLNTAVRAFRVLSGPGSPGQPRGTVSPQRPPARATPEARGAGEPADSVYAGDYRGAGTISYSPEADGSPDPGEIVWTWVPYEEDYSRGKDRPVLVIGYHRGLLLALMMTSRDRNNGRNRDDDYVDIGSGAWDVRGRPSEVKLDRVLQLDPSAVRREGAVLPRAAFDQVAQAMRRRGWN